MGYDIDDNLCGWIYKEYNWSIVNWSRTDPDANMNWFTWYNKDSAWIVPEYLYKTQTLKENGKTKDTCRKYSGSYKFSGISREVNLEITIKSYRYQRHKHMISNLIWDISTLLDPLNQYNKWDLILHQYLFTLDYIKTCQYNSEGI